MTNNCPKKKLLSILTILCVLISQGCVSTENVKKEVPLDPGAIWEQAGIGLGIAPVDANIYEITASGVLEERPDWSRQSKTIIENVAKEKLQELFRVNTALWPMLSASEQKVLDEHIALYDLLSASKDMSILLSADWRERFDNQDMCLGTGLAFLARKTNIDVMMVFDGQQGRSTSGRLAMMLLAAAAGVAIPTGQSHLEVAAIDLHTGNVLWQSEVASPAHSLTDRSGASSMLNTVLKRFDELTDEIRASD